MSEIKLTAKEFDIIIKDKKGETIEEHHHRGDGATLIIPIVDIEKENLTVSIKSDAKEVYYNGIDVKKLDRFAIANNDTVEVVR